MNIFFFFVQHTDQCFSMFCQQGAAPHPEEELDRLTKKLVYDMNHPPSEDYFGMLRHFTPSVLYFCFYSMRFNKGHGFHFLPQVGVLGVGIMFWEKAVAVLPWSRCFTWSASPVSPVMLV